MTLRGRKPGIATGLLYLLVVVLLIDPVLPAFGGDPELDRGATGDGEFGIAGGVMPLMRPAGCAGPQAINGAFGGLEGRVRLQSKATQDNWHNRALLRARGTARYVVPNGYQDQNSQPAQDSNRLVGVGNVQVGWSSRYLELSGGIQLSNTGENEEFVPIPSVSLRLGPQATHLRLGLADGPGCIVASCIFNAEGVVSWDPRFQLRAGASVGPVMPRAYLQVPVRLGKDKPFLTPGLELSMPSPLNGDLSLLATLSIGFPAH